MSDQTAMEKQKPKNTTVPSQFGHRSALLPRSENFRIAMLFLKLFLEFPTRKLLFLSLGGGMRRDELREAWRRAASPGRRTSIYFFIY